MLGIKGRWVFLGFKWESEGVEWVVEVSLGGHCQWLLRSVNTECLGFLGSTEGDGDGVYKLRIVLFYWVNE